MKILRYLCAFLFMASSLFAGTVTDTNNNYVFKNVTVVTNNAATTNNATGSLMWTNYGGTSLGPNPSFATVTASSGFTGGGLSTLTNLTVNGASSVGGTLSVGGTTTLTNLTVNGVVTQNGTGTNVFMGSLGVGTNGTATGVQLQVNGGDLSVQPSANGGAHGLLVRSSDNAYGIAFRCNTNNTGTIRASGVDTMMFSNSCVGILNAAPNATLDINGSLLVTAPDYTVSYMGYPKITLTTNMVSSFSGGGTTIVLDSFTNAFDNNFSSVTTTSTLAINQGQAYLITLPNIYSGFIVYSIVTVCAGSQLSMGSGGTVSPAVWNAAGGTIQGIPVIGGDISLSVAGTVTNCIVKPFTGKYYYLNGWSGNNGTVPTFWFRDISIYAVTNGYVSFTGTLQ